MRRSSNESRKIAMNPRHISRKNEGSESVVTRTLKGSLQLRRKLSIATCAAVLGVAAAWSQHAHAHGFNANFVDIVKTFGRKYRVIIKYTHVELGEYREAHIDFDSKEEAIKAFQDLANGADFFLGDVKKSIHFHTPPETPAPY